jgi:xylulokinase
MKYVIAYDMGTGGLKSSIFDERGVSIVSSFKQCATYYPAPDFREQRPAEWWDIFVRGTKELLAKSSVPVQDIAAMACSGHSLGVVPLDKDGGVLAEYVPIWNDARAAKQAGEVFSKLSEEAWYLKTGNGFPAPLYAAYKILWYKENARELYDAAQTFIGTKDYLNYRLTGVIATDYSYASGSGVYDLHRYAYDTEYIKAFGLRESDFPPIVGSGDIIGTIRPETAALLGLSPTLLVAAGGVDNACMAAGAGCVEEGMAYTSLGSSAWIAVSSHKPVLNFKTKPYVFAHLIKGMYTSAESIFSAGNTHRWVRDTLCLDLTEKERAGGEDAYKIMDNLAGGSPPGSKGLFFIPTLGGATALDRSPHAKGAIAGLDLQHTRGDIIRAALEGICFGLRNALEELKKIVALQDEMLIVGGGSKSVLWRRLFADIYGMNITESAVGENAGSLGAMACAAVGAGLWKDFTPLINLNKPVSVVTRDRENSGLYDKLYQVFKKINDQQSDIPAFRREAETRFAAPAWAPGKS